MRNSIPYFCSLLSFFIYLATNLFCVFHIRYSANAIFCCFFKYIFIFLRSALVTVVHLLDTETRLALEVIRLNEEKFQPGAEEEAVVILGLGGNGKSSLSLLLTDGEMESIHDDRKFSIPYKFVDKNNRICRWSIGCGFIFPNIDTFNGTAYYDWTGFLEFRSSEFPEKAVLPSQFLKKLARSNKSVKFVFAINEFAVNPPNGYSLFKKSAKLAKDLFVNITKYRNAIGFVSTKAWSFSNGKNLTEEETIAYAVRYLEYMRDRLENGKEQDDDSASIKQFIDILLEKNGDKYKIGVFNIPTESGSVKELTLEQNNKNFIRSMIANQLQFVKTDANDFGYAVLERTKRTDLYKKLMLELKSGSLP